MIESRIIGLPWPPARLNPNASKQGSWRAKSKAASSYKNACLWEIKSQGVEHMRSGRVDVTVTFCPPSMRRYDLDNMLSRCKQGLDAVAEAIGVDDGRWDSMTLRRGEKLKGGRVILFVVALNYA